MSINKIYNNLENEFTIKFYTILNILKPYGVNFLFFSTFFPLFSIELKVTIESFVFFISDWKN